MAHLMVYVFHPNRGELEDEVSEHVQDVLGKFLVENEEEEFWHNCTALWRGRFQQFGKTDFAAYLLEEGFVAVPRVVFETESANAQKLLRLNKCDVAGFFIQETPNAPPESVWQLLNRNGRIDSIYTDPDDLTMPLRTNTGREVQSCLIGRLDRENTPAPDAYVLCGDWIEDNWPDPISGEWHGRSPDETNNMPWEELFWTEVENFSPNTRVTAVNCHY